MVKKSPKFEEREMHEVLRDYYSVLPVLGGFFPFLHTRGWRIVSLIHYTIMYSVMILAEVNVAYTTYLVRDRPSLLSQSLHLFIVGLVAMGCSLFLTLQRRKIKDYTTIFNHQFSMCEYANNNFFVGISKKTSQLNKVRILTWFAMYGSCGVVGILQPVINSFFDIHFEVIQLNGVWMNLPFLMWCPWDLEKSNTAWFWAFLFQGVYLSYCAVVVTSAIVMQFNVIDRLLDQFKLITYGVKTLDQRAKIIFKERYPMLTRKLNKRAYENCFYDCIKQSVLHHLRVGKEYKSFVELSTVPVAVPFYGGAILLGMAMITMTADDDPRIGPKFFYGMMAVSEFINMYLICQAGQNFEDITTEMFTALYQTRWYLWPKRTQKALMIMRFGCIRPLKYKCAMLVLNMELFSELVNSAYSIFNLKAASSS
uniref:Odorant receptor n=1 Tax=Cyrtorhinus lividipennis TaxID=1032904 RepID=A0A346TI21_9HEMI|nr:odorant receptor 13 [Cyrtorhinus lividipennis]